MRRLASQLLREIGALGRRKDIRPWNPAGSPPEVRLSVHLDVICSRNPFTRDPAPVVTELLATAGERVDIPTESAGTWVGYFEDTAPRILSTARRALPGFEPWIALGQGRRSLPEPRTLTVWT